MCYKRMTIIFLNTITDAISERALDVRFRLTTPQGFGAREYATAAASHCLEAGEDVPDAKDHVNASQKPNLLEPQ